LIWKIGNVQRLNGALQVNLNRQYDDYLISTGPSEHGIIHRWFHGGIEFKVVVIFLYSSFISHIFIAMGKKVKI